MGLAIANRLVRLMGGELSVESSEGAGSRFTFTLPAGEIRRQGDRDGCADGFWGSDHGRGVGDGAPGDADAGYQS